MKVSMKHCEDYDFIRIKEIINSQINSLGGINKFVKPGEKVLLKPNLVMKKNPEAAATTHPVIVKAIASLLIDYGASVVIGDSPGGPFTAGMLNGIYKATGMEQVANETGATLNQNFGSFKMENPDGLIMKNLTLADMLNDVDKVICIAKLKTHAMMTYTGAVKNMFGLVPGIIKGKYHLNKPGYDAFSDALIDICIASKPVLSIIDGIVGMEGNGPTAGTPVKTNAILISESPYHLDFVACKLIGLKPEDVPLLKRLIERKIALFEDIELTCDNYDVFKSNPYKIPPKQKSMADLSNPKIPRFIRTFVTRCLMTRPFFDKKICNGCGVCKESCPVNIIEIKNNQASLDYRDCIRCYCCQELCPRKAINVKKPFLSKLMRL